MRISLILPPVGLSGGIRVLAIYAQGLQARGHEVTVVSPAHYRPSALRRAVRYLRGRRERWGPTRPVPYFKEAGVRHQVLETYRPVRDADVPDGDVVVATWWETAPWVADLSAAKGAKAYFVQDYGAAGQELEKVVPTWSLPLHLITISRFLMDLMREHGVTAPIDLVPNGVDTNLFHAPPRERNATPTVGTIYRELPEKGCGVVLEAVRIARERVPGLRLVGFGGRRPEPVPAALDGASFTWGASDAELRTIYASCDAWLFGSRREGFGLPLLEAMACRTPVVATPAGAAPELTEPGGGALVPADDPAAMADAIERVVTAPPETWRAMSDTAFATARTYSWPRAIERFEAALRQAVDARSA